MRRRVVALAGAGALLGLAAGCLVTNTQHCGYPEADNPCPAGYVCSKCAADNNGCVPAAQAASIEQSCLATTVSATETTLDTTTGDPPTGPTSEPTTTEQTDTTTTIEPTTVDPTTNTTEAPLCDPDVLLEDTNYCGDPGEPYCVAPSVCGPCTDLGMSGKSCKDVDANKGACDSGSGLCVQCTEQDTTNCPADKPACEPETYTCVACFEHFHCPSGACDLEEGQCFPEESKVIYVQNTAGVCSNGDGSAGNPYCNFAEATSDIEPGEPTIVRVRDGQDDFMQPLVLEGEGYLLAVIGEGTPGPLLNGKNNVDPMIAAPTNSAVYIGNIRFKDPGTEPMLSCNLGQLYLDDGRLESDGIKPESALSASECFVQLRRTIVVNNYSGVYLSGGKLRVENSFFSGNGTPAASFSVFNLAGIGEADIVYTTIVENEPTKAVFSCTAGATYRVYNSAILRWDVGSGCAPQVFTSVDEKVDNAPDENAEFTKMFASGVDGKYDPKPAGPLKDAAMWAEGMPKKDYNGTLRPTTKPGFAGAVEDL